MKHPRILALAAFWSCPCDARLYGMEVERRQTVPYPDSRKPNPKRLAKSGVLLYIC